MVLIKSVDLFRSSGAYESISQRCSSGSREVCLQFRWGAVLLNRVSRGRFMCTYTYMSLGPFISEGLSVVPGSGRSACCKQKRQEGVWVGSHSLLFQKGFHHIVPCQTWLWFSTISPCFSFPLSCVSRQWQLTWKVIFLLFSAIIQSCRSFPVGYSSGDGHLTIFMGSSKICNHIPGTWC